MDYPTDEVPPANGQDINGTLVDVDSQLVPEALDNVNEVHILEDMSPEALQKMLEGRFRALKLCDRFNNLPSPDYVPGMDVEYVQSNPPEKVGILAELLNVSPERVKKDFTIFPRFLCDYGYNIEFKGTCFINWDCTILDAGKVTIGHQAIFGPGVKIFGSGHPIDPDERYTSGPLAYDVTIGNQVWIGGNSTIVGPCTIGNGVVVAAGSVVTKGTYPDDVVLGGNPARILKRITRKSQLTSSSSTKKDA